MALRSISARVKNIPFRSVFDVQKRSVGDLTNYDTQDVVTHTGQRWENDDYRMARFTNKEKHVNPNWAINLVSEIDPIPVTGRVASCDGGGGPTGHPLVYINLDKPGNHSCLYCGLRYFKEGGAH